MRRERLFRLGSALLWLLILGILWPAGQVRADVFPLQPSFRGAITPADWILGGGAYLTAGSGIDPAGQGWLRLTEAAGNRNGYAYYDVAFPSDRGLVVTFDYVAWGGSGADGLTFFLFDGDTATFSPGGFGGSLGYAQRSGIDGLSNGYLGVGIDEFGNFSNPNEGRNGGPGFRRDAIAIRGPGSGQSGYAYVAGTTSLPQGLDFPRVTARPSQAGSQFRRVEIRLESGPSGYTVEVLLQTGYDGSLEQVIAPTLIGQNPPATLKMGFTASTGGATNYHEIRNLSVSAADLPTELVGTVTERVGGLPIPNASISVVDAQGHNLHATSDGTGQWSISSETAELVPGTANVAASYAGFCTESSSIDLAEAVTNTLDLSLDPARISGVVTDAATDVPLVGATVILTDALGLTFVTTSGAAGAYSFQNTLAQPIATGNVSLSATKINYATKRVNAAVSDCGPNIIPLALDTSDIWFFKTDGRTTVSPGELLTYTLSLENRGSLAAEGVVVVDELLAHSHVSIVDMTPGGIQVGPVITWTLPGALAVDATASLTVTVRVNDALPDGTTVLANYGHAIVTGSPEADRTSNEQTDLTTVTAHPNLTIAKTATTESVPVGVSQRITYTLTGDNRGHALATGVVITDVLDGLVTYVPGSATLVVGGGTAPLTVTQTSPNIVFSLPDIPAGMSGHLSYAVSTIGSFPLGTTAISNTATVVLDQQDGDPSNNSDGYRMPLQAWMDLHVAKLAIPESMPSGPGGRVCTQLRYGNYGTTAGANATFTDTLPVLASFVPGSLYVNGLPAGDPPIVAGVMDLGTVDPLFATARYEGQISYTLRISDVLPAGVKEILNTAVITDAVLPDDFVGNNRASAVTPVEAAPDLEIALDDGLTFVEVDDTITWTLSFANVGNQDASGVMITVTLGDGVDYVPDSASDLGAYNSGAHAVEWNLPALAVGQPLAYTFQATVAETHSAGSLAFAEALIADDGANGDDPTPGNNYDMDVDRVIRPYVVVSKTMSEPLVVGELVTFTIGYRNFSKAPGRNALMTDTLPSYLDFVDASGNWSLVGDDIVWDLGTVAPRSQASVLLTTTLTGMPAIPEHVSPSLARDLVPVHETITSTLTDVSSPWYSGTALPPTVRVLWQDDQSVGPLGWNSNLRLPSAPAYSTWPAPVAAGIETFYWLDQDDLAAQWIAHDPAGQPYPNYSFFRHLFYLPINIVQPRVALHIAADDLADAWVNGVYVGQDYGAGGATTLSDVKGIQAGSNLLAVRLLNNDHGGHAAYVDPQGRNLCHPGLLYRLQVDYLLRPFVQAPPVVRAGDTYSLIVDEAVLAGEPPYVLSIDYGEGLAGTSSTSHIYMTPGTYTVTVQATDALGQLGTDTFTVDVQPAYSHLVVNNVCLQAESKTHAYCSQEGTANAAFLGLEQVVGIDKTLVEQVEQPDGSYRLCYQITITSTRVQVDDLPLYDSFDPTQMTLLSADPEPDGQPYPGLIVWDDLTAAAPHGFGRALTGSNPMVVSATFRVDAGVSGLITNTVSVDGASDNAGLSVNACQTDSVLDLARGSASVSSPLAWGNLGVVCAGWNQRWTLSAVNDGARALTGVTLTARISEALHPQQYDVLWDLCTAGALPGGDGQVLWTVPLLAAGDTIERELVLRPYSSVPVGTTFEVCTMLESTQFDSDPACSQSEVGPCQDLSPTPSPPPTPEGVSSYYVPLILRD